MPNTGGIFQLGPGRGRPSVAIGAPGLTPQRCAGIRRDSPGRSVSEEVLASSGRCRSLGMFCARKHPFPSRVASLPSFGSGARGGSAARCLGCVPTCPGVLVEQGVFPGPSSGCPQGTLWHHWEPWLLSHPLCLILEASLDRARLLVPLGMLSLPSSGSSSIAVGTWVLSPRVPPLCLCVDLRLSGSLDALGDLSPFLVAFGSCPCDLPVPRAPCGVSLGSWAPLGKTHGSGGYVWPAGSLSGHLQPSGGGRKRRSRRSRRPGHPPAAPHSSFPVPFPGVPPRAHSRDSVDAVDGRATPTENALPPARMEKPPSVLPFFSRPPALPLMGLPPPPMPPPPPLSSAFGVPPPPPGIPYQHLLPPPPRLPPPLAVPPPGAVPPALHLNPAFFPPPTAALGPPPDTYGKAMAPYNHSR